MAMAASAGSNVNMTAPADSSGNSSVAGGADPAAGGVQVMTTAMVMVGHGRVEQLLLHGWLMYLPFGLLFPLGLIFARFMQLARKHGRPSSTIRLLFHAHLALQGLGIVIMTIGAVVSFRDFGFYMIHTHGRLGLCLWLLIWMQALSSMRPALGSKKRMVWFIAHWLVGTTSVVLGVYDIYVGLYMWEQRTGVSVKPMNIAFSVSVAAMAAVYLLQGRWENLAFQHYVVHDPSSSNDLHRINKVAPNAIVNPSASAEVILVHNSINIPC